MNATTCFSGWLVLMNLFAVAAASGATVASFDLEKQFSTNSNPNGPWSYGYKSNYAGAFAVVTEHETAGTGDGVPIEYWNAVFGSPVFYHNATTNTGHNSDEPSTWPPNVVIAFPGDSPESHYGVVRFATPGNSNGLYRLEASARSYIDGPAAGDTDYAVVLNGAAVFSAALPGQGQTAFTNIYFLSAGSTLDFAVGPGADGSSYASGLKLSARLFYLSNSPPRPTISAQPQSVTNRVTSNVTFSVVASPLPLAYQWRRSGAALPGETNRILSFTNLTGTEAGNYTVLASNSAGSVTSAVAVLTIDKKPRILTQPQAARLPQGWNAYFDVSAEGPPPLRFQWRRSGTAISGATNAQYVRTNLTTGGAGNYTVVVSNNFGAVTSAVAVLTVPTGAAFDVQRDFVLTNSNFAWSYGIFHPEYWPYYSLTRTTNLVAGNGVSLQAWLSASGQGATVILHNGTSQTATYPGSISYPPGTLALFTEPNWESGFTTVRLTLPPGGPGKYQIVASAVPHRTPLLGNIGFYISANNEWLRGVSVPAPGGIAVTNILSLEAGDTLNMIMSSVDSFENLVPDGVKLSATLNIWTNPIVGPVITNQPVGASPRENGTVSFLVQAAGTPLLHYQWLLNDVPLAGANSQRLTLYGVQPTNTGAYQAVVRNNSGAVTSAVAVLSIDYSPVVTSQPQSLNRRYGETAEFVAGADGGLPFVYQWRKNGSTLPSATNATLVLAALTLNDAASYSVVIGNAFGSVTSAPAALAVDPAPYINTDPATKAVLAGISTLFQVAAAGAPPLRYQWRLNGSLLAGATNSALVLGNVQMNQAGNYSVVVANSFGQVASMSARLAVLSSAIFDVPADFGLGGNPNGIWSYGYYAPPDRSFTLAPVSGTLLSDNGVPLDFWRMDKPPFLIPAYYRPAFYHNATVNPATNGGPSGFSPGALVFFPGPSLETSRAVVRLTIPEGGSGTYLIETRGQPHSDGAPFGELEFQLAANNQTIFTQALPDENGFAVTNQFQLLAGETVDFVIATPRTGSYEPVGLDLQASARRVAPFTNPSLWSDARQANGTIEIHFQGDANRTYQLLSSTDLAVWTPVSVFAHAVQDHLAFTVPTTNSQRRFYRVVTP